MAHVAPIDDKFSKKRLEEHYKNIGIKPVGVVGVDNQGVNNADDKFNNSVWNSSKDFTADSSRSASTSVAQTGVAQAGTASGVGVTQNPDTDPMSMNGSVFTVDNNFSNHRLQANGVSSSQGVNTVTPKSVNQPGATDNQPGKPGNPTDDANGKKGFNAVLDSLRYTTTEKTPNATGEATLTAAEPPKSEGVNPEGTPNVGEKPEANGEDNTVRDSAKEEPDKKVDENDSAKQDTADAINKKEANDAEKARLLAEQKKAEEARKEQVT